MHLAIFGYYYLADGYLACSRSLAKEGFTISFFPFMLYYKSMTPEATIEAAIDFLHGKGGDPSCIYPSTMPDVLLIWIGNPDISQILERLRREYNGTIILFNWDLNWMNVDHPHWIQEKKFRTESIRNVDWIFSVNPSEVTDLKRQGHKIIHCYPGYDESLSYPEPDHEAVCDVSAVVTTLYTDEIWDPKLQVIGRKDLLDRLYADDSISLAIYGPSHLEAIYPKAYRGFAPYDTCRKIFFNSRVNLCISPVYIPNYFSERAPQIIGSGGLLVSDNEIGNGFIPGRDYVLVGKDAYETIKQLLQDEDKRRTIARNGYEKISPSRGEI